MLIKNNLVYGRRGAAVSRWCQLMGCWALLCCVLPGVAVQAAVLPDDGAYRAFLTHYRQTSPLGAVIDYRAVTSAHRRQLAGYVRALEAVNPEALSEQAQIAYWVNLYNSRMILLVLEEGVPVSVKAIKPNLSAWLAGGPWKLPVVTVAGQSLSFDDIEHGILRQRWQEPRLHFVLNCASIGCPDLPPEPLEASRLEQQLVQAALAFINAPKGVRKTPNGWVLSRIFDWFGDDFGADLAARLNYINRYRQSPIPLNADIRYDYDWALNAPQAAR